MLRWEEHSACMRCQQYIKGLVGKLEEKNHLEVLGVGGRILKYTLNNRMGLWAQLMCLKKQTSGGLLQTQ